MDKFIVTAIISYEQKIEVTAENHAKAEEIARTTLEGGTKMRVAIHQVSKVLP